MEDFVNVYLRVKPRQLKGNENIDDEFVDNSSSTDKMLVVDSHPYQFNKVFYGNSSQEDVFKNMIESKVDKIIEGFNCLVFAYGQSGSGKTHTIGLRDFTKDPIRDEGIVIRTIDSLFNKLEIRNENFSVNVSFIEIYKEKAYDLLSKDRNKPFYQKGNTFHGSSKFEIKNSDDAREIIAQGNRNRHVRETILNPTSSRSHAMFTIEVKSENVNAYMNICDLAGSEGLRSTNHSGTPQKEGVDINKGLLALKRAIQELGKRKNVTSHRDSVLTMILQKSLNLKSYFSIIGCITSRREDKTETLSTVRFLQDIKKLDVVPEMNAFRQRQRSIQTPLKNYMLPTSRNSSILNKTPSNLNVSRVGQPSTIKKRPVPYGSIASRYQTPGMSKLPTAAFTSTAIKGNISIDSESSSIHQSCRESVLSLGNCSTSTEIDMPNSTPISTTNNVTSFSPYDRKIKALEDQLKFYQHALLSTANFNQFQQSMMFSMANNETKANSDLNSTFSITENESKITQKNIATVKPMMMDFSKLETTQFTNRIEPTSRENPARRSIRNRQNISIHDISEDSGNNTIVVRVPSIQSRKSVRIQQKVAAKMSIMEEEKMRKKSMDIEDLLSSSIDVNSPQFEKRLLAIFNEGSMEELQKIPEVGRKTAITIIVKRKLKKFKKFDDLNVIGRPALMRWIDHFISN